MCKLDVIKKNWWADWLSAIKCHHYPMPTVDEVLSKLGGAKIVSKLNASSGYWQIKVDQARSHWENISRSHDYGRRYQADPRKIEAITNMPTPSNKMEVERFLGMLMYLGKFLLNLSEETACLRQLLERDVDWHFDESHHKAIQRWKHLVVSSRILTYFDHNHALRITADASKSGLGAVLEQYHEVVWRPIAYASRVMTQSKQNYPQIEKETLATVFVFQRFHEYT